MADTATLIAPTESAQSAPSAPQGSDGPSGYQGSRPRREGSGGGGRGGRDFRTRRKVCIFCVEKIKDIDYKDTNRLRRFISDRGKIEPRRKTGTCAKHQRRLSVSLKRARFMALLPYTGEHIRSIEAGGHGSHSDRRDVGRPDRSQVETPEVVGAGDAAGGEGAVAGGAAEAGAATAAIAPAGAAPLDTTASSETSTEAGAAGEVASSVAPATSPVEGAASEA